MVSARTDSASGIRSPLWAKVVLSLGAMLMVVSIGGVVFGLDLIGKINSVGQSDTGIAQDEDGKLDSGPLNILLVGADLRVEDSDGAALADTMMILHINKELTKANIVSLPRDLKVPMEDGNDCETGECMDRLNAAYTFGFNPNHDPDEGLKNLREVITDYTGIEIHANGLVNFEGFLDVVETFGSIELCLDQNLDTKHGGSYQKGCKRYEPDDALAIVRERYQWNDGDYGRQRMQQHFVKQLVKEAGAQGYLKDPTKVGALIEQIGSQLRLDLGGVKPVDYVLGLRDIKPDGMKTLRLPSEPKTEYPNGQRVDYVVIKDGAQREASDALFKALRDDTLDEWMKQNPDWINTDPSK